ncbi:DUF397 domain-containing protein [Streptomyces syringium]|uniref:DUF397 domain-containing protein n=1 Tax=Streptomyces syringium TaxID=76729 RepID=UPI0034116E04
MQHGFQFRKSRFSNAECECVEIATNVADVVAIRDSKIPDGPIIRLSPASWHTFHTALLNGTFNR